METLGVSAEGAVAAVFVLLVVLSGGDKCTLEETGELTRIISVRKSLLCIEGGLQSV